MDNAILKELYKAFIIDINKLKEDMQKDMKNKNMDAVGKNVHSIMGLASNYRAKKVFDVAKKLSLKQKENNIKQIQYYYMTLNEVIDETIEIIKEDLSTSMGINTGA